MVLDTNSHNKEKTTKLSLEGVSALKVQASGA
jgi:hypothetical protein